jgi:uncharacterized protein (TIGR02118 family)
METSDGVRLLTLLTRRPDISPEAFAEHWRVVHAPLVLALPGLRTYRQYDVLSEIPRAGQTISGPEINGVVELRFDSWAARNSAYAGPAGAALMADGANFVLGGRTIQLNRRTLLTS